MRFSAHGLRARSACDVVRTWFPWLAICATSSAEKMACETDLRRWLYVRLCVWVQVARNTVERDGPSARACAVLCVPSDDVQQAGAVLADERRVEQVHVRRVLRMCRSDQAESMSAKGGRAMGGAQREGAIDRGRPGIDRDRRRSTGQCRRLPYPSRSPSSPPLLSFPSLSFPLRLFPSSRASRCSVPCCGTRSRRGSARGGRARAPCPTCDARPLRRTAAARGSSIRSRRSSRRRRTSRTGSLSRRRARTRTRTRREHTNDG